MPPENLTLVGALLLALGWLGKLHLDYIADIKAARDVWRSQAQDAVSGLRDLSEAIYTVAPSLRKSIVDEAAAARTRRRGRTDDR